MVHQDGAAHSGGAVFLVSSRLQAAGDRLTRRSDADPSGGVRFRLPRHRGARLPPRASRRSSSPSGSCAHRGRTSEEGRISRRGDGPVDLIYRRANFGTGCCRATRARRSSAGRNASPMVPYPASPSEGRRGPGTVTGSVSRAARSSPPGMASCNTRARRPTASRRPRPRSRSRGLPSRRRHRRAR